MSEQAQTGAIVWTDLTCENADEVRDFYEKVVGWSVTDTSMGDYNDYTMCKPDGVDAVAGVCHARGSNKGLPPQWLIYVNVEDLSQSLKHCEALGGSIVSGPAALAGGQFCVVSDPAGAVMALFQP